MANKGRPVIIFDSETGRGREYPSISNASRSEHIGRERIRRALDSERGWIFGTIPPVYVDEPITSEDMRMAEKL